MAEPFGAIGLLKKYADWLEAASAIWSKTPAARRDGQANARRGRRRYGGSVQRGPTGRRANKTFRVSPQLFNCGVARVYGGRRPPTEAAFTQPVGSTSGALGPRSGAGKVSSIRCLRLVAFSTTAAATLGSFEFFIHVVHRGHPCSQNMAARAAIRATIGIRSRVGAIRRAGLRPCSFMPSIPGASLFITTC
jgi:hypothetical protein